MAVGSYLTGLYSGTPPLPPSHPSSPFNGDLVQNSTPSKSAEVIVKLLLESSTQESSTLITEIYNVDGLTKIIEVFRCIVNLDPSFNERKCAIMEALAAEPYSCNVCMLTGITLLQHDPGSFSDFLTFTPMNFVFDFFEQFKKTIGEEHSPVILLDAVKRISLSDAPLKFKATSCHFLLGIYPEDVSNHFDSWMKNEDLLTLGRLVSLCKNEKFTIAALRTPFKSADWKGQASFLTGVVEGWEDIDKSIPDCILRLAKYKKWPHEKLQPNILELPLPVQKAFYNAIDEDLRNQFLEAYATNGMILAAWLSGLLARCTEPSDKLSHAQCVLGYVKENNNTLKNFLKELMQHSGCMIYVVWAMEQDDLDNLQNLPPDVPEGMTQEDLAALPPDAISLLTGTFLRHLWDSAELWTVDDIESFLGDVTEDMVDKMCSQYALPYEFDTNMISELPLSALSNYALSALGDTQPGEPLAHNFGRVLRQIPCFMISMGCIDDNIRDTFWRLLRYMDPRQIRAFACAISRDSNPRYVVEAVSTITDQMQLSEYKELLQGLPLVFLKPYLNHICKKYNNSNDELAKVQNVFGEISKMFSVTDADFAKVHAAASEITGTAESLIKKHYTPHMRALHQFVIQYCQDLTVPIKKEIPVEVTNLKSWLDNWSQSLQLLYAPEGWVQYLRINRPVEDVPNQNLQFGQGLLCITRKQAAQLGLTEPRKLNTFGISSDDDLRVLGLTSENKADHYRLLSAYLRQVDNFDGVWKLLKVLFMDSISRLVELDVVAPPDLFKLSTLPSLQPFLESARVRLEKAEKERQAKDKAENGQPKRVRNDRKGT